MATTITHTVAESGGDYTTLAAWEAAQQRSLTAADEIARCEVSGTWVAAETDRCYVQGWTCDATRYVIIEALDDGARHDGKWSETAHRIENTDEGCYRANEFYTKFVGLQGRRSGTSATFGGALEGVNGMAGGHYMDCIARVNPSGGANVAALYTSVFDAASPPNPLFINCLAIDDAPTLGNLVYGFYLFTSTQLTVLLNCTIANFKTAGASVGTNSKVTLKNVLITNCGDNIVTNDLHADSRNVMSDDGGAISGGSGHKVSQTFTFVNAAAGDFSLAEGDVGARGEGVDLSGVFTTDLVGTTRSAWDAGCLEYDAGEPPAPGGATEQYVHVGVRPLVRSLLTTVR